MLDPVLNPVQQPEPVPYSITSTYEAHQYKEESDEESDEADEGVETFWPLYTDEDASVHNATQRCLAPLLSTQLLCTGDGSAGSRC